MMVVDDEFILVGSANINQRSLAGSRDTEIAAAGYQAADGGDGSSDSAGSGALRDGQVHGFRMSLWLEHLGALRPEFASPGLPACARLVRQLAAANWAAYSDDGRVAALPSGHLCCYPVAVGQDGSLGTLPEAQCFPDTNARVCGRDSFLPDFLTT